jgi:signal transduction histidine kinase
MVSGLTALAVLAPKLVGAPIFSSVETAVVVTFAAAGMILLQDPEQRVNGRALLVTATLVLTTQLADYQVNPFPMVGWVAYRLAPVMLAVVLLRYPRPALHDWFERGWAVLTPVWLVGLRVIFSVPTSWHDLWPTPAGLPRLRADISNAQNVSSTVLAAIFVVLLVRRFRRARRMERREVAPLVWAASTAVVATVLHEITTGQGSPRPPTWILVIEGIALLFVPGALLAASVLRHLARASVADLLTRLDRPIDAIDLQAALIDALTDTDLRVLFWLPEQKYWADTGGVQALATPTLGQIALPVDNFSGTPLALLLTDANVARNRTLLSAVVSASRLALENAQLQASLLAQLAEVCDSRTRMAMATFDERRRVERDLHDGVQQRILALSTTLARARLAATDNITTTELIDLAGTELASTLAELRDFARGIHPAVLTQVGLAAAIDSAAERLPIKVFIAIPGTRWPATVEATAYYVICEAVTNAARHSGAEKVEVSVRGRDGVLMLEVRDDGHGGAHESGGTGLVGLRDRVAAAGGTMSIDSPKGMGTCIKAKILFASH